MPCPSIAQAAGLQKALWAGSPAGARTQVKGQAGYIRVQARGAGAGRGGNVIWCIVGAGRKRKGVGVCW